MTPRKTKKKVVRKKATPKVKYIVVWDMNWGDDPVKECYTLDGVNTHIQDELRGDEDVDQDSIRVYQVTGKIGKPTTSIKFT